MDYKIERECINHGLTTFILTNKKKSWYGCRTCRYDYVRKSRRKRKETLVQEFGGKCSLCGYSKSIRALEFHHLDPKQKLFAISGNRLGGSLASLREEAKKCILVCANCHAEIEEANEPDVYPPSDKR